MTQKPTYEDLEKKVDLLEKGALRHRKAEKRVKHLNRVLQAIRKVHQLTTTEKDRDRLIKGVCERLTDTRGYGYAWIVLMNDSGEFVTAADSGLGWHFLPMLDRLEKGELPDRMRHALKQPGLLITEDPSFTCGDCPLCAHYRGTGAMTVRLDFEGRVYGLLSASIPAEFLNDREEHSLLRGLAEDLALALDRLEVNEKYGQAERAVRESERSFRALAENAGDGIAILGKDGSHLYVNKRAAKMSGYSVEELLQSGMLNVISPDEHHKVIETLGKRMRGEALPPSYETVILRKDGTTLPVEVTGAKTFWQGKPADIVFSRDITKRKQAQEELNRKHAELESIFKAIPDAVIFADLERKLTRVNPGFTKLFGYEPEEIYGRKTRVLYTNQEDFETQGKIRYNPNARELYQPYEIEYQRKDGETFLSETVGMPVRDERDEAIGLLAIVRDITDRNRAERALHESEENFRALAENAGDGVCILVEEGSLLYANRRMAELLGYSVEEMLRINVFDLIPPDERERIREVVKQRLAGRAAPPTHETHLVRADGEAFPVEVTGARTLWRGQLADIVITRDITERKRAEEALRESEQFGSKILENSPNPIVVFNADTSIRFVNPAFEALTGFSSSEVKGWKAPFPWWTEEKMGKIEGDFNEAFRSGLQEREELFQKKSGERFWVAITFRPVEIEGEVKYYLSNWIDVTERKRAEKAVRENEERFRNAVENAPFGYYRVGRDGLWQYVNAQWEQMYGLSLEEIKGSSFELTHPKDLRRHARDNVKRALNGETISGDFARRRRDGTQAYHTYNIQPVYKGGEIVAIEGFINDLTKQKQAEDYIRKLSHQLLKAQEKERQMISRELHDRLAQDISASKIACDTLLDDPSEADPKLRLRIAELSKALERTIMAVRDLSYDLRPPGLDQMGLVQTIFGYCQDFSDRHDLSVNFQSAGLDRLRLDEDTEINLYRMVQEGLNNALRHAEAQHINVKLVAAYPDIILRIEDNGRGFDVERRITSAASERRMGLRSMEERTALLGGKIEINSRPSEGTRICVTLPYWDNSQDLDEDKGLSG